MDRLIERGLAEIDWQALTANRDYFASPTEWADQVLYFLFVDRFSDGREHGGFGDLAGTPVSGPSAERTTPLFDLAADAGRAVRDAWFEAGKGWCGGHLRGLTEKLGYLQRMGVTAVWLSPVFRQVTDSSDYHGYGIQNFLDVDPHFGTRDELRDFVAQAHAAGIRVILDIILNHAGDVFAYAGGHRYFYHAGMRWPVAGLRARRDDPGSLPFPPAGGTVADAVWPEGAVWPREFQGVDTWSRQGEIRNWDAFPEYLDGDFLSLKDMDHGEGLDDPALAWDLLRRIDAFRPSATLARLAEVYKFWIAFADIDGYRIDTVKHMQPGAVRYFANVIHEYAQSLGKDCFYLIGEITGGRAHAVDIVDTTGIDAALGINDVPDQLEFLAKGWRSPGSPHSPEQDGYFDLFRNSLLDNKHSHQWYGSHVVTMFDDHDQVGVRHKFRFAGQPGAYVFLKPALALNLLTAGIPCLYYGTEQGFDGADRRADDDSYSDAFLRECMFGGPFGSLQSQGRHFFDETHELYAFVAQLCELRRRHIALRRGRQYLRQVSSSGREDDFHYPQPLGGELRWVVAWSRLFADREYLCAINTDPDRALEVWIVIDHDLHPPGAGELTCLLSTDPAQTGTRRPVEPRKGSSLRLRVPPAGAVVYG